MKYKSLSKLLLLVLIGGGLFVGLKLVGQQQLVDKEAAVPGGTVTMSLHPASQNLTIDQQTTVEVKMNTGSASVRGYQAYLSFTYTGTQSPIEILGNTTSTTNATLTQCLVNSIIHDTGTKRYTISVSCLLPIGSATPYSTAGQDASLFSFDIKGKIQGSVNLDFDTNVTKVTDFTSAQDILAIPTGGVYSVGTGTPTNTPSPTQPQGQPTNTPTPSPTTPAGQPSNTPAPTAAPTGAPNSCGGTCGSNLNCDPSLICWYGYCRNPYCVNTASCNCSQPAATATPTRVPTSGSLYPTPTTEVVDYVSPTPQTTYTEINPFLGGPNEGELQEVPPVEYADEAQDEDLGFFARIIRAISNFFKKLFGQE